MIWNKQQIYIHNNNIKYFNNPQLYKGGWKKKTIGSIYGIFENNLIKIIGNSSIYNMGWIFITPPKRGGWEENRDIIKKMTMGRNNNIYNKYNTNNVNIKNKR